MIFGFEPLGWAPFGFFGDDLDLSSPSPIDALLRVPLLQRSYILYAQPRALMNGEAVTLPVRIGDGYASYEDDTLPDGTPMAHALFRAGLIVAYNASNNVLSGGHISDSPDAVHGDAIFELASGRFADWLKWEWDSAEMLILMGLPQWRLRQFGVIFSGVSGPIDSADSMEAHLPLLDNSYRLKKNIQSASYTGMGPALRGDGSSATGTVTLSAPSGSMAFSGWIRPKTVSAALRYICGWQSGTAPGGCYVRFEAVSGQLGFTVINDGGAIYTATVSGLTAGRRYHFAASRNVAAATITLDVHDAELDEVGSSTVAVTGAFTTVLTAFRTMRRPDAASGFGDLDLDNLILWNTALTTTMIEDSMSRVIPADSSGTVAIWRHNEATGATVFDANAGAKHLTYGGTVKWVGSLEGGAELVGQPPPIWEGVNREVRPVNVDSQNYVYEVSRNPTVVTVTDPKVKGAPTLTMDAPVSDIYDWTPVEGHCVTSYMDGRTLLRLEAAPDGALTVTVTSDTTTTAEVIKKLAKTYGGFTDAHLELGSFATVALNYTGEIGIGVRLANREIWDMMQEIARKAGGWVTTTRTGLIALTILSTPGTPRFHLNENDISAAGVERVALTLAVKQVRLGYRPYEVTQSPTELATSLTEAQKIDLGQPLRYTATPVATAVVAARSNALPLEQDTLYDSEVVTRAEALRRQALWGVNRVTFKLPLTRGLFQYSIGDTISVTVRAPDGTYVEDLRETPLIVTGYTEDPRLETIILEAWGAEPEKIVALVTDDGLLLLIDIEAGNEGADHLLLD